MKEKKLKRKGELQNKMEGASTEEVGTQRKAKC